MIGIDSNILIAWLLEDPQGRPPAIRHLAEQDPPLHVAQIVLAETIWVLSTKRRLPRPALGAVVQGLLDDPDVVIEGAPLVTQALGAYLQGGPGFIDHLIGATNRAAGCRTTYTLDRVAARGPLFTPLPEV